MRPFPREWVPHVLVGLGVALAGVALVEVLVYAILPARMDVASVANMLTSFSFIAILVAGGYSLSRGGLHPDRFPRIAAWTLAGFGFLVAFFALIAIFTQDTLVVQIGILRWAAAAGAGAGALVGIFEARAIERALTAERTQIRNEELRRQNERLDDFAHIIAHDLRNPLSVVSGRIDIARKKFDDDGLDSAAASLERMSQIIEETLTLARSGIVIDEPEAVELANLVNQSWQNVSTERATLVIGSGPTVSADRARLQHLFENLFRNAVEHGGPDVTLRVGALPDGFYVEDDGPGIPEDVRVRIFDAGYSTSESGAGLGLSIVKQIADAHGWNVVATEGSPSGARFDVSGVAEVEAEERERTLNTPLLEF